MGKLVKCYWCERKVSPTVGIHPSCWEALKGFSLSNADLPKLS